MPFSKFIVIPIGLAIQAFILMMIAQYFPGSTQAVGGPGLLIFVTFQAWAVYFAAGCTPYNGLKVFIAYALGIAASIGVLEISNILGPSMGGTWGTATAVFIIVIPVICFEKVELCNFIPGIFIGSGMFFAMITLGGHYTQEIQQGGEVVKTIAKENLFCWGGYGKIALAELIGCAVGQCFGFITVFWRGAYEAKVKGSAAAK